MISNIEITKKVRQLFAQYFQYLSHFQIIQCNLPTNVIFGVATSTFLLAATTGVMFFEIGLPPMVTPAVVAVEVVVLPVVADELVTTTGSVDGIGLPSLV